MPPRHAYWTILVDDQPTAFRAHDPEELLPTLNRLREKNQTAVMKWFERGQLFESRDAARDVGYGQGERRWEGPRPDRRGDDDRPRDQNWRPGGEHRDPRQKYRDAKKAKWDRFKQKVRARHDRRTEDRVDSRRENPRAPSPGPKFSPPHGDPLRRRGRERPRVDRPFEDRQGKPSRPHGDRLRPRPKQQDRRRSADSPRGKSFGAGQGKWGSKRETDRPRRRRDDDE